MPFEEFQRLGLALAIGLLAGIERGWHAREVAEGGRTAGLRTYALIGLLGGVAGELGKSLGGWAFAAVMVPFAAAFVVFKYREQQADKDFSVTAVVAALLVFALGGYAVVGGDWRVAAAAAVVMTGFLAFKGLLHGWLERLTWEELRSAIVLLAMSFVALPLLPNRAFGPFGVFNPYELWLLSILLAAISFAAYVAVKAFGTSRGLLLGAAVGALVSSTATTLFLARRNREAPEAVLTHAGATLLVGAVMAVRVGAIAGALAPAVLWPMLWPLAAFIGVSLALGALLVWRGGRREAGDDAPPLTSPFDLISVFKFTLLLGAVMAVAKAVSGLYGPQGLFPVAAVAGLVDVDAITLTIGRMAAGGLDAATAARAVLLAGAVNTLSKAGIAGAMGGLRFGALVTGGSLAALAAAAAALWFASGAPLATG